MLLAPADDAAELVRAGYCEEWQPSGQYSPLEYFSVIEIDKNRRRAIFWPKRLLSQSTYQSAFTLPSVDQYRKTVHAGNWAVAFDLSASFAQVALPAESRLAFKSSEVSCTGCDDCPTALTSRPRSQCAWHSVQRKDFP